MLQEKKRKEREEILAKERAAERDHELEARITNAQKTKHRNITRKYETVTNMYSSYENPYPLPKKKHLK